MTTIPVHRRLELLKVVAQFLQDNLSGDCSDTEPPVKGMDGQSKIYAIRVFALQRLDMSISDTEAGHVDLVLKKLFEDAFHECAQ
jgi:hypothetical protein